MAWFRGQILELLDSFIESLVQKVNRGCFRFELGNSSNSPQLSRPQAQCYEAQRLRDNTNHLSLDWDDNGPNLNVSITLHDLLSPNLLNGSR